MKIVLRALAAAALVYAGYVHFDLATRYDSGEALSTGNQFRAMFVASMVAALILLVPRRWAWLPAIGVALATLAAVLASVYLSVGAIGPLPPLPHEPWYAEKAYSAIAEGVVLAIGAVALLIEGKRGRARTSPTGEATTPGQETN